MHLPMLPIFDRVLEIGAHVRSNLCYLICSRHLIRTRAVTHLICFSSCMRNMFSVIILYKYHAESSDGLDIWPCYISDLRQDIKFRMWPRISEIQNDKFSIQSLPDTGAKVLANLISGATLKTTPHSSSCSSRMSSLKTCVNSLV